MFCHKCGTQIAEDAAFCPKCGTKVVYEDTEPQELKAATVSSEQGEGSSGTPVQKAHIESVRAVMSTESVTDYETDFKTFVDDYVRQVTKFQSAKELLKNSKPQMFLWFCYGIPAVIGLEAGGLLGALLFGIFFGTVASLIWGGITRNCYIAKTIGRFEGSIDISDLLQFLNVHLSYLQPYFHEGKYNAGVLNIPFGVKQKSTAIINIIHDTENTNSNSWKYVFDAQNNPSTLSRIIGVTFFSFLQVYQPKHTCIFKTIPILQAAMEYYLNHYRKK